MIIIFHLFERTRCDPLSVGIKSKNGGKQSGYFVVSCLFRASEQVQEDCKSCESDRILYWISNIKKRLDEEVLLF